MRLLLLSCLSLLLRASLSQDACATRHLQGADRERLFERVEEWKRHRRLQEVQHNVETYFHVIQFDQTRGVVLDSSITIWMRALNRAFEGTGLTFDFQGRTTTVNRSFFVCNSENDIDFKSALRVGEKSTLNIYLCQPPSGVFGWSTPPSDDDLQRDGVVMFSSNVPTDSQQFFNQGDTLTHLVGEWLGLLHTHEVRGGSVGAAVTILGSDPLFTGRMHPVRWRWHRRHSSPCGTYLVCWLPRRDLLDEASLEHLPG